MAREEREEELFRLLKRAFASQRRAIIAQARDGKIHMDEEWWRKQNEKMVAILQKEAQNSLVEGAEQTFNDFFNVKQGDLLGEVAAAAAELSRNFTIDIVRGINQTTRDFVVDELYSHITNPESTMPMFQERLSTVLGDARAKLVAVTETTRAFFQGGEMVRNEIESEGFELVGIWHTAADNLVCPVCGPLNGTRENKGGGWGARGLTPPAHPHCRCDVGYELASEAPDALGQVQYTPEDLRRLEQRAKELGIKAAYEMDDIIEMVLREEEYQHAHGLNPELDLYRFTSREERAAFLREQHRNTRANDEYIARVLDASIKAVEEGKAEAFPLMIRKHAGYESTGAYTYASAVYSPTYIRMYDPDVGTNTSEFTIGDDDIKTANAQGTVMYGDRVKANYVHEYGHHHSMTVNPEILRRAEQAYSDIQSSSTQEQWVKDNISWYAIESPKELAAEAYVISRHPQYTTLDTEVRDYVDDLLGE